MKNLLNSFCSPIFIFTGQQPGVHLPERGALLPDGGGDEGAGPHRRLRGGLRRGGGRHAGAQELLRRE